MTTDENAQAASVALRAAEAIADVARQLAEANTREILTRLDRIEAQVTKINGRVSSHDLLFAEMKGIAQGAGGTGRLLMYMLSAAAGTGTILVALLTVAGHIK